MSKESTHDIKAQERSNCQKDSDVAIPVENYIARYDVENPLVTEVLFEFPSLVYLLGNVSEEKGRDAKFENIVRPYFFVTEGSGLFGLKNPDDAWRWKGIFNHVIGTSRQTYSLATDIAHATKEERQELVEGGISIASFDELDPLILRDFMFVSHAKRRSMDERAWYNVRDKAHPDGDSGVLTLEYLKEELAPRIFQKYMRVEHHADHLAVITEGRGMFPDVVDNVLTYSDWRYGQRPNTLKERFEGLRASGRAEEHVLDILEQAGKYFEDLLHRVFGEIITQHMVDAGPYEWETKVRRAYCSPSGLDPREVFPTYTEQYPGVFDK